MIDLGYVAVGATIRLPWDSFAAATGAPSATTNYAAGDVIIFHSLLLHASGPNTSPNSRRAYIVTYNADAS